MATGADAAEVLPLVTNLRGARGRLELAATTRTGAPIFIDYAHTPDALAKALDALRPYVHNRLTVVFGCGGDRDKGKRPQMGAVAVDKADIAIVTDDNPRSEEPSEIRREILAAAPGAIEVPGRAAAVAEAVADLKQGDVLLIAGKGHETGQIVKGAIFPYSDHDAVDVALKGGAKRA
jgi:UDP-N-acetylmuramoyl-L-alanyl-D-glutamate--2,6-diaminopimelate ligase